MISLHSDSFEAIEAIKTIPNELFSARSCLTSNLCSPIEKNCKYYFETCLQQKRNSNFT